MRYLKLLAAICCLSAAGLAQSVSTVSGQLTLNGRAVANSEIRLVSPQATYTASTDAEGNYRFENVADGNYLLVSNGRDARAVLVRNGSVTVSELAEVVTVAADTYQQIEQVSKTVNVIDGPEMRERADFSLVESLRTIPGFRIQQLGGFGKVASLKTRGLRNQDTAVLIDGMRFRDPASIGGDATPFLSDFTLTSVSRIEVLRGSGSSLYGTNAIGGVVDFQTPTAREGTHGQIGGAIGGLGLRRFRANLSHGIESGRFGIGAGVSRTAYTKGIDGDDDAHNTNLQLRVDADPATRTSISVRIFYSNADVRLNTSPDTFGTLPNANSKIINASPGVNFTPDANDPDSRQDSKFFSGQLSFIQAFENGLVLSGHYHGLSTERQNDNGSLGPGFQSASTSIFDGQIDTANAKLTWSNTTNTFTTGYEFERERFGNEGRTPSGSGNFFTRARQRSNTFFAQHLLSLDEDRLQLAGGVRVQQARLGQPEFSLTNAPYSGLTLDDPPTAYTFDGAASYYFRRSGTKIRAHVGNGYRVPSLYERFGTFFSSFGTPSFVALGDPFLKPEKSTAFDAGIEQYAAKERVKLTATYFCTKLSDIIGFANVAPNIGSTQRPFGGYVNQSGGIARGGEFIVKATHGRSTDIFASYTYTNSDQRTPQVSGSGVIQTLGIPDHQFTLVATQRYARAWVNFDLLMTSSYLAPIFSGTTFNTYIYRFRGNRRGDVTAGYTFGDRRMLRIFGTVENVFDNEYYENGFRTAKANVRFGTSFAF